MSRNHLERRLTDIGLRVRALREEARIGEEQLAQVSDEAEEARLRALVSETPLAERERREAQGHADTMLRELAGVRAELARLEAQQDELLDRLVAEGQR